MPITFKVGFQVDDKELTQGLSGIRKDIENAFNVKSGMSAEVQKATQQAIILEKAIKRATTDKGISYYSLTSELAKAGTNAAKLTSTLAAGGRQFSASLNAANIALATADRSVISLNSKIKEMSRVMVQSFKFTAAQTFIRAISNEVRQAYQWVEELNSAITNIGVVTGKTAAQLDLVTQSAIQGAKELRVAASEYAQGQLIFYQQGLSDDEVTKRTEITVKAAAAANQSMADMSSQLTAIWNTYKMTGDEMQRAASVGAKMAGDTAVDFADIAEAMQTAAAPAEQMGVSYNSLAAIIATVGDTTQQSASVIGNAFKTIFSRFQQLKSEGTDGEVTLNRVSSQLQELGVNVLDSAGNLRSLDTVIAEVGDQWDSWSSKQQLAIAQLVGGTRQYGQFLTLMNNFDKYQDLLSSANVEDGSALEQQYASSLESIESHALNASEAWKRAFSDLFDEDMVKGFYSLLEGMGNAVGGLIDGLGGLPGILTITAMLLSQKIVPSLLNGARQAALMYQNLNPDKRRANIEKEYTAQTTQIDKRLGETNNEAERESLNIQKQKTEFGRKVAVINDEINTKLRTASGEYKINLEYQQKMLQSAQELYQSTLDQLSALSQESQKNSNLLKIEEKRAQVAMERAQAQAAILGGEATTASNEARQATQERQNLENQYNANNTKLQQAIQDRANKNPKSKSYAKADAEVSRLTAEQAKLSEQLAQARQNEALATEKAKRAQEAYKKAQASADQATVAANSKKVAAAMEEVTAAYAKFEATNSDEDFNLLNAALTKLKGTMDSVGIDISSLPDIETEKDQANIQALIQDMNELILKSEQLDDSVTQAAVNSSAAIDSAGKKGQAEERRDKAGASVDDGPDLAGGEVNFDAAITGITQLGMAAVSTFTIITNLFSILQNPDLSGTEKAISIISTVFMGLLTILPAVAGAFVMLKNAGITSIAQLNAAIASNPIGLAIMAIVAAITAAVAAFAIFSDMAYKASPQGKLDAAAESAEALNAQLEETKARAEEVQEAFNNYNTVTDALDECVKGTQEWRDALSEVNNAVIDLIQQFPELTTMVNEAGEKAITRNADGQLEIADWAQDQILQTQEDAINAAQGAAYAGQQQVRSAQINVQRSNIKGSLYSEAGGLSASDAVLGGIASILSPGAWIPMLIGGLKSADIAGEADVIADNAEQLSGLVGEELNAKLTEIFDNAGISADVDKWVGIIEGMGSDFTELTAAIQANTEAKNLENQAMADQIMADSGYANSTAGSMALEAGGEIYGQLQEQAYEKYMNTDMADWLGVGTSEGKAMWADYADAMGISDLSGYKVTNYRKDGGVEYEYIDENGQRQTGEATKEMIASTLAAADAAEQLEGNLSELRATIADLNASANAYDRAMAAFLSKGNFEGASVGELDSIREQVGFQDTTGLEGQALTDAQNANKEAVTDYVNSALGGDDGVLSDEEAQAMGYESANAFIQAFTEGLDVDIELPSGLGEGIADQLSVGASKAINDTYEKMGEEGGQAYLDTLQTIYDSVDWSSMTPEEASQAWDQIANIDWSNMDAANQAAQIVRNLGGEIDTTTEAWKNNVTTMQDAMDATYDVASKMEQINNIQSIASDIELGSTITKEDYDALVAYNEELAKYFTILADGSAVMTGDPLDFQQEIQKQNRQELEAMIQRNVAEVNELRDQYNAGVQALGGADNLDQYRDTENYVGEDGNNYYKGSNVQTQLDFLASQGYDQDQLDAWQLDLEDGETTTKVLEDIAAAVNETGNAFQNATTQIDNFEAENQYLMNSLAATASSYDELEEMYNGGQGSINQEAFDSAAMNLQTKDKWEGMDVDEVQEYADYLEEAADKSDILSDSLEGNSEAAEDVALYTKKMNKGIEDLSEGFEDWSDVLENSDAGSEEYMEAMDGMKSAMSDVLGVSEDFLSDDFILENMEDIEKAANGDAEAIDRLAIAAGKDILVNLDIQDEGVREDVLALHDQLAAEIPNIEVGATLSDGDFLTKAAQIVETANMTVAEANAYFRSMGFEPNFETKTVPITQQLKGTRTYTTNVKVGTRWLNQGGERVPFNYIARADTRTEEVDLGTKTEMMEVPALTTDGGEPNFTLTRTNAGAMNNYSGSNSGGGPVGGGDGGGGGGGGGSAPEHSAKNASKYDPITDRYATIKSSIEEVQRSVDALSDAQDDAWGGDKVRNMQKINAELQRQGRNLQKLRKLTLDYLDIDQGDAQIAAKDLITNLTKEGLPGLSLDKILFNSDGFVSNRTEITQQLNDYLESLYTPYYDAAMAYDRANSTDEAESERIDALKEKYDVAKAFVDEFLAALDLVDETAQEAADALEQQLENIRTWMANKVEEATYKMEFKIGISDRDISLIEQAIDLWGDLGTKMGKTFDLLGNQLTEETSQFYNTLEHGNRMIEIIENIDPTNANDAAWFKNEFGEEAWNEYISGNGGLPAEVLEAMQDDADSMIGYMNSMYDTAEEMFGQYIEVLNMYMEEFDKIADKISANNDKLEMFQELLEFSGRRYTSAGRNSIRNIANASVDNAVLEVERAASALELAEQGAKETSQQLEDFLRDTNKDPSEFDNVEAFTYNQLKAAKDEADQILADAQSDMTSSIQDLASAAADAIEMVAEVIKEEVAANLGGDFASIDDMMTMYDQQYDLDTFFLRDFDKEYQLSSLLGEIEDQMEDITDPERLKEYESLIGEINAANQEGVDLTQTDVDLLKAKFEIQKAQDAYEEAQNAKNTMRLARDASGNWSYVYSADSENTEDAAQKLADAQYNYEKLLWEASDEASQYWLQAQQDFFQFQETIDWARYEHDEQYRAQIDKQLQYYQEKTELYAAQVTKYNDMLGVSFDETSLGVVTNMQDMESAQDWYTQQHEYYTNELNANTQHYQQVVADACNKVGISYDELEEVVDDETQLMMKENDALRGTIEKLNIEGGRSLSQLNTKVSQFRVKFVEDMKLATKALEEFLAKLEGYENESLDRMNYTGFDAYTDYTAAINNYVGEALQSGMTKEELMSDEGLKKLAYELGNKLNSDMLYELEHTTVKDRWNERTSYDAVDYMAQKIAEVMEKLDQGIWERWDEVDEWSEQHREEIQNYGKTASGGLIKTPQVRSLAEDGPELVLNSTDTQNILDAVKNMREVVKLKMSFMNSDIQKKTDGNVQKTIINKDVQQLDQQVHIDATFPNVSVAAEIEEAFNNLVNQAVQYASRK